LELLVCFVSKPCHTCLPNFVKSMVTNYVLKVTRRGEAICPLQDA
jgi:hypothetical protein